jgi:hypothetical protein
MYFSSFGLNVSQIQRYVQSQVVSPGIIVQGSTIPTQQTMAIGQIRTPYGMTIGNAVQAPDGTVTIVDGPYAGQTATPQYGGRQILMGYNPSGGPSTDIDLGTLTMPDGNTLGHGVKPAGSVGATVVVTDGQYAGQIASAVFDPLQGTFRGWIPTGTRASGSYIDAINAALQPEAIVPPGMISKPSSGLGVAAAGAGAGFLVGGPIGALVGGTAGFVMGRRK